MADTELLADLLHQRRQLGGVEVVGVAHGAGILRIGDQLGAAPGLAEIVLQGDGLGKAHVAGAAQHPVGGKVLAGHLIGASEGVVVVLVAATDRRLGPVDELYALLEGGIGAAHEPGLVHADVA